MTNIESMLFTYTNYVLHWVHAALGLANFNNSLRTSAALRAGRYHVDLDLCKYIYIVFYILGRVTPIGAGYQQRPQPIRGSAYHHKGDLIGG